MTKVTKITISKEFAARQLDRVSGLRFFPKRPAAFAELVRALMKAPSEKRAEEFVSDWLRENSEAPTPHDIYAGLSSGLLPEWTPSWLTRNRTPARRDLRS